VRLQLVVDCTVRVNTTVVPGQPLLNQTLNLADATTLEVIASTESACGASKQGYGAFVDTFVLR
jgi:hypothetical protein